MGLECFDEAVTDTPFGRGSERSPCRSGPCWTSVRLSARGLVVMMVLAGRWEWPSTHDANMRPFDRLVQVRVVKDQKR